MDHPLVNPSLTPVGFVFPVSQRRLEFMLQPHEVDGDRVAAKFWELKNCARAEGLRPTEVIIHEVLPSMDSSLDHEWYDFDFVFKGFRYLSRDILVLSTFMQWFGSNVGYSFLTEIPFDLEVHDTAQEFRLKLVHAEKKHPITAGLLCCTPRCITARGSWACVTNHGDVAKRDTAVVNALMTWLGMPQGRAYIEEYKAYRRQALETA